jgi:transposase
MAGKKGMRHYPLELREEAARLHIEEGITLKELAIRYGTDISRIKKWCKWKRERGTCLQTDHSAKRGRPTQTEESLEQKVKRLEMENALLKKFHELLWEERKRK